MTPADRVRAAERLLGDPLAMELLSEIEANAVEAVLEAETDVGRRFCCDTVKTIRSLRDSLRNVIAAQPATSEGASPYA